MSPYEAAIGERSRNYYLSKFEGFDEQGPGFHVSWNWAAFFFTGFWALYRKMYGWFMAWVFILIFFGLAGRAALTSPAGSFWVIVANFAVVISFAAYANSLYHRKVKGRIAAKQKPNLDALQVSRRLSAGGGVHMWVPIGLGGLTIFCVVAAVALPAYEDYTKRQTVAASPAPNSRPVKRNQIDEFLDGAPKLAQAERGPWEQYQYQDGVAARTRGDYVNAQSIFRTLAERGYASAQGDLGVMYNHGHGVTQDYAESVKWYRLAAAQGNFNAQRNLGIMLLLG